MEILGSLGRKVNCLQFQEPGRRIMRRRILFLSTLLIAVVGFAVSAPAQSTRSGEPISLTVTFNDGHQQNIALDEVSRIEFKSAPVVIFKDGHQQSMAKIARIE